MRVVERHGADLHYVHPWKVWLVWDGKRWKEDNTGEVPRRVKETQEALYLEAANRLQELPTDSDDLAIKAARNDALQLLKHSLKWEDARAISRCIELMKSEPGAPVLPGDLDCDQFRFNVLNGTIDLRTGELRPHRREDLITKLAPVQYNPELRDEDCHHFLPFLEKIMAGNASLIGYLQRVFGYCMTGVVSEQALWFFHGTGANGKSTLLGTILAMLGDYGMQSVSDLLMVKNHESHPTERADLFGRRFVATIETEEGKRIAEALMKQMTGADKIRARRMRQDFFEFDPTHKIVLAANHKPTIRGTDHAAWRRIKLVPFGVTISDEEKDKELPEKLKREQSAILAWAVRGCLEWQARGLGEPDEVRLATEVYRSEQDSVQAFLNERCLLHRDAKVKASELLEAYHAWSGDRLMTRQAFNQRLREKGFESKRGHGGSYFWQGIGWSPEGEGEDG